MKKLTNNIVRAPSCPYRTVIKLLNILLFLSLITFYNYSFGQKTAGNIINGVVYSVADNSVLAGATIKNNKDGKQAVTNAQGEFELNVADVTGTLTISYVGYKTSTVSYYLNNYGPFNISLVPTDALLKEVVVSNGYQLLPKERATGSFSQVDSTLLSRRVSTDVLSRLEGVVPGLLFNRNTLSSANGIPDINIRGHSTLFSNDQPLIVVDGFPYDGDINNINPNDIASITVLKDAAAASIWGVRSGNGVIVLTTKKGKRNQKLSVELNANVTIGEKPDLFYSSNFLNSTDFINIEQLLFKQGFYNSQIGDPTQVLSPVVQIMADEQSGSITSQDGDSQIASFKSQDVRNDLSKYFYTKSVLQQYNLNFKGGGDNSDYFFSIGEDHNQTNEVGNVNNRLTLNGNYNFYPIKNLTLSAGINFVQSDNQNNSPVGNINDGGNFAGFIYPYARLADVNGNALPIVRDYNFDYTSSATQLGLLNWEFKPLDELHDADNNTTSIDNRINFGANYKVIPGLNLSLKYQYEKESVNVNDYYSTDTYFTRNRINSFTQFNSDGTLSYPVPIGGILQQSDAYLTTQNFRGQLSYDKKLSAKNEINIIAGSELISTVNEGDGNTAYGYNKNTETNYSEIDYLDYFTLNPSGGASQIPNGQGYSKTTDHYLSYYSNASYTFDSRITLSASARIDRSNLFGVTTNQKAVPLYSAGVLWDISREKFYHIGWLPFFKIRATYGYNANINKSATAVATLQQQSNSYYSGIPYDVIANPGNPELRWEKDRVINFGIDYGLQKNIISGSIEYYLKKSTDLFGNSPLPPSTGLSTFFGNTASISGNGFDVVINSRNIDYGNFKWTSNLMVSYVLDKVTKYDQPVVPLSYLSLGSGSSGIITPLVGQPLFGIYSFRSGPLTHDTGDPQGYLNGQLSTDYNSILSNFKFSDLLYNGPARPTTFGSFRNNFSYKYWTLSANMIFKFDYYFRKTSTGISYPAIVYGAVNKDYANRWQQPGDETKTTVPSIQLPPDNNDRDIFYQYSQSLVDRADNIRFQDLRLSYEIPRVKGSKFPFSHFQVYGYVNNIGILWRANHDNLDPDIYTSALPLSTTFSLGIHTNF